MKFILPQFLKAFVNLVWRMCVNSFDFSQPCRDLLNMMTPHLSGPAGPRYRYSWRQTDRAICRQILDRGYATCLLLVSLKSVWWYNCAKARKKCEGRVPCSASCIGLTVSYLPWMTFGRFDRLICDLTCTYCDSSYLPRFPIFTMWHTSTVNRFKG